MAEETSAEQRCHALTLEQFSAGVVRVVNANMERALRVVSIERGYDPREFALVAFGGAGGLHACELAEALAIPTVMIPARPGALSAFGILVSDVVKDYSRTVLWRFADQLIAATRNWIKNFASWKRRRRKNFARNGGAARFSYERSLRPALSRPGLRTQRAGQTGNAKRSNKDRRRMATRKASSPASMTNISAVTAITTRDGRLNWSRCVCARVCARRIPSRTQSQCPIQSRKIHRRGKPAARVIPIERAPVFFQNKKLTTPVFERGDLIFGRSMSGPAVITEYSATTVIPPGKKFWVDESGNLMIKIR